MMADIEKQEVARLPIKQSSNFIFKFNEGDWFVPVKRIWGKKEITRVCFKIIQDGKENWFECGIKLAERIQQEVDKVLTDIDISQVDYLYFSIVRDKEGTRVSIDTTKFPSQSRWKRIWKSIKKVFG